MMVFVHSEHKHSVTSSVFNLSLTKMQCPVSALSHRTGSYIDRRSFSTSMNVILQWTVVEQLVLQMRCTENGRGNNSADFNYIDCSSKCEIKFQTFPR